MTRVVRSVTMGEPSGKTPVKLETTQRHLGEIECVIQSVYSGAKISDPTLSEIRKQLKERVFYTNRYKNLPGYAKDKVSYMIGAIRKSVIDEYVHLFYIGLDGRLIPTHKYLELTEEENNILKGGGLEIRWIWMKEVIQHNDNGSVIKIFTPTDKVYWTNRWAAS